ncbi:hypothetical protein [Staphylococcus equorum]|uniref:Uncharacterized protein n=1 Tax=Staphylococcus equorum TaxID=246432 RepID=A0AAP7LV07_9STAP|nr:hypothetical protein [Staphylococcus equorum]OEK58981.1 hypothetical protein ASS94_01250 [Staphylococcus equorum]
MNKITTELKLKGLKKRLSDAYGDLRRYEHYEEIGFDFPDDIKKHKAEVEQYKDMLSSYRVDVVFLKATKVVKYSSHQVA